ncbi:class I SAM-dependent methyltransferase [Priestia taiwanensis]|uniref:Methyltransferase n=1 Tax=Priestia taiwanensis TaxID=1347902 RepID=A0A917ANJ5_9BACI|nr:class I SAM-dependent methyltransferase [Priestia taiwanensis]MBM7362462.1 ubiquinone/menaquinone biosynthesis C-methylase UbiE [Priestia taiwanensis]GGE62385.1 methyltransferase [Priestia taiwanensis]
MNNCSYFDLLAYLGVEEAHPGGFELTKKMLGAVRIASGMSVLEVGCGTGKTAGYIYEQYKCDVSAIEPNSEMFAKAQRKFHQLQLPIKLFNAQAENLPFQDSRFDIIISESVTAFCYIPAALKEYTRVLKKDGVLLAIEMTKEKQLQKEEEKEICQLYNIPNILTEEEWRMSFARAGFSKYKVLLRQTIAETTPHNGETMLNHPIPSHLWNVWSTHQHITEKYREVLGHRVFICKK